MKKLFILITVLSLALALAVLPVSATESETQTAPISESESENETKTDTSLSQVESKDNFFELVYNEIIKHSDKILSALAFAASLILAFAYNKGLIPVLTGALDRLQGAVVTIKDTAEAGNALTSETVCEINRRLQNAGDVISKVSDSIVALEERLADMEGASEAKLFKTVLSSQVDMLYEIFISSSLPQYQKEAVGEKIAEMRKALSEVKENENKG